MATTQLRERMRQLLRVRNYSSRTEETYIEAVARYASHFGRRPDLLGADEVRAYQLWQREEQHVSASYFNQTAAALRFLYAEVLQRPETVERLLWAKREKKLPVVLSAEELRRFLESIPDLRYRVLLTTIYSAGLRISEALHLRAEDIDSSRMLIRIQSGKGNKDRYVPLSPIVLEMLRAHFRREHLRDLLFPARRNPLRPVDPSTVQRYMQRLAVRSGLTKRVTPHTLRHSFATHLVEQGTSTRVIQVLLGHANARSTETYAHVSPQTLQGAASPLDRLIAKPQKTS